MEEQTVPRVSVWSRLVAHWRVVLDTAATVSMIAVCITLVWVLLVDRRERPVQAAAPPANAPKAPPAARPPQPAPTEPLSLKGAQLMGNASAKVAMVEYSDFQCPYCSAFVRDALPALAEKYVKPGKVLLAFRHLPLESIHPFAVKAAEAAECAGRQGKFWQMHDVMFQNPKQLDPLNLARMAGTIGVDASGFTTCLDGQAAAKVKEDAASAGPLGISGTPSFFLGTVMPDGRVKVAQRLVGAQPAKQFEMVLDKLLAGT